MNAKFSPFEHQKYLNLETFRKNGLGIRTPVWFVLDGDAIYIRTGASSGKVKRIRHTTKVNIAPCTKDGVLVGDWVHVLAREVKDKAVHHKVGRLLAKKYGIIEILSSLLGGRNGPVIAILELKGSE